MHGGRVALGRRLARKEEAPAHLQHSFVGVKSVSKSQHSYTFTSPHHNLVINFCMGQASTAAFLVRP